MKNIIVGLVVMLLAPLANATTYQYATFNLALPFGASADALFTEYNTNSSVMTFALDNLTKNGILMDGFWLVTNDGPDNPQGEDGLAIMYADFNSNSLWAFEYNGQNDPSSYAFTDYLGDFSYGLFSSGTTLGFSFDVSPIYDLIASSAPFDEQIGIWLHPTWDTQTVTDLTGRLIDWEFSSQTYFDTPGWDTIIVPVPGALLLYASALFGLGWVGRTRSK